MLEGEPKLRNREEVTSQISVRRIFLTSSGSELSFDEALKAGICEQSPALAKLTDLRFAKGKPHRDDRASAALYRLGWASAEPASDLGHLRYYPPGLLVFRLIQEWQRSLITQTTGAAEIRTPMLFDWSQEMLRDEAGTFHDRLYYVRGFGEERTFVLPFGGDFGTFCILRDLQLHQEHLPYRVFESASSFRFEQSGAVKTLHRNRAFSFFDYHSACVGEEQGWKEFQTLFQLHYELSCDLGLTVATEFTLTEEVFREHKHRFVQMISDKGTPVLLELLSGPKHYWCAKYVFYTSAGYRIFNSQLDLENGPRYGIGYTDHSGQKHPCVICHASWASVERWMLIHLEDSLMRDVPVLPLWLAPTQVRILPVKPDHITEALQLAKLLVDRRVRTDVDDRNRNLGLKLKGAAEQWIPYVVVFGDRERDGVFQVRCREEQSELPMSVEALVARLHELVSGKPWVEPLFPLALTRRPAYSLG